MKSFFVSASKSLKSSLFNIFRTRLEIKAWFPYESQGSQAHVCLGLHIVVMIAGILISHEIFAVDMLKALKPLENTIASRLHV